MGNVVQNMTISEHHIESLFVELKIGDSVVLAGVVYRLPSGDRSLFTDRFEGIVSLAGQKNYGGRLICGDFNLNLLNINGDLNVSNCFGLLSSYAYMSLITRPTRITNETCTLIDNIFTQDMGNVVSGIIPHDLSDHYIIFMVHSVFFRTPSLKVNPWNIGC